MSQYFISKGSGELTEGVEVEWEFPEFEGSYPVKVKKIIPNELIILDWDPQSEIEIKLESIDENSTVVMVHEEGNQMDVEGIKWAVGQTEGWANFLACMKAYLEYGVHLRKGAFDFMKK